MNFEKLKNQKGVTGIDIVIAITIISITSVAILALYANIVVNSKNVTRTSAATRIATSILENIDYMYYAEVEQELERLIKIDGIYKGEYSDTATYDIFISSKLKQNVFNTKLNSGYDVELVVNEISSPSNTTEYIPVKDCPLVLEIKAIVSFNVSGKKQEISLKTIKKRELLQEANEPNLNNLLGREFDITVTKPDGTSSIERRKIESLNQVQPIKWSTSSESYIRTNKTDEWYSYLNKEWARVVITGVELDEENNTVKAVFDTNTDSVLNISDQTIFMWVPRFGISTNSSQEVGFTYGSSNDKILPLTLRVGRAGTTYANLFKYNGIAKYDFPDEQYEQFDLTGDESKLQNKKLLGKEILTVTNFKEGQTGMWVEISGGKIKYDVEQGITADFETHLNKTINKSSYGPPITRVGSDLNKYY